jgi:hypothetical protein
MKQSEFKKMLKEAVREVFQEEMKEILLEAIKNNKQPIIENNITKPKPDEEVVKSFRKSLMTSIMGENDSHTFTTNNIQLAYTPPPINTIGEGSALPPGDVSLDQIMNLFNK